MIIVQKTDLSSNSFANDNSNAADVASASGNIWLSGAMVVA